MIFDIASVEENWHTSGDSDIAINSCNVSQLLQLERTFYN